MRHREFMAGARQVFVLEKPINNVVLNTVIGFHLVVEQEVAAELSATCLICLGACMALRKSMERNASIS